MNAFGSATQGCVLGTLVSSQDGTAIGGAAVTAAGVALSTSNTQGWFSDSGVAQGDIVFCFQATGFVTTCRTFTVEGAKTTNFPPIKMVPLAAAQALNSVTFGVAQDATTGAYINAAAGTLCGSDRATAVTTQVSCSLTPISTADAAPGEFMGVQADGTSAGLTSGGMMDIVCTDAGGNAVNTCTEQTVTARIPILGWTAAGCAALPATIASWSFNTTTGLWEEVGTLAKSCGADATTSYYSGNVTHFSWWNADYPGAFTCLTGSVMAPSGTTGNGLATVVCNLWDAADTTATVRSTRSVQSEDDGTFCLPIVKSDSSVTVSYSCVAKKGEFVSNAITGTASSTAAACGGDGCAAIGTFLLTDPLFRTTLTWGASSSAVPSDLDSHFISSDGATQIYYMDKDVDLTKGSLTAAPYIELDTDDTTYEGPENTTVVSGVTAGTYRFCVHNYSGDGDLTTSQAHVVVSGSGSSLPRAYNVPSSPAGGNVWQVYEVTIGSDNSLTFNDLNKIVTGDDAKSGCLQ